MNQHGTVYRRARGIGGSAWCLIAAVLVAVLLQFAFAPPGADAQEAEPVELELSVEQAEVVIGDHVNLSVRLTTQGVPVNDGRITFFIDDIEARQTRTDVNGVATFRTSRQLEAGTYVITADYEGSRNLASASASRTIVIHPWTLEVETVPPLEGATFSVDDQHFTSGPDGVARVEITQSRIYRLEYQSFESTVSGASASFQRWGHDLFVPHQQVKLPADHRLSATLQVSNLVSFSFVDLAGVPVPQERVSSITVRSTIGKLYTLTELEPIWVESQVIGAQQNPQSIREAPIIGYSVQTVIVDGVNVVNHAQQRFEAGPNAVWQVEMLLFSAEFKARDALFGFPIGRAFHLDYPDGQVAQVPLGRGASARIDSLARGVYHVSVVDPPGMAPPAPVAVVRDQQVELKVISYFDIVVVAILGVSVAAGLILLGRPEIGRTLHRRTRLGTKLPSAVSLWSIVLTVMGMTSAGLLIGSYSLTSGAIDVNDDFVPNAVAFDAPATTPTVLPEPSPTPANADQGQTPTAEVPPAVVVPTEVPSAVPSPTPQTGGPIEVDVLFRQFWEQNGAASVFGEPLTTIYYDAATEYWTQSFEFAVLEYHPRQPNAKDHIQLRLLGVVDARRANFTEEAIHPAFEPQSSVAPFNSDCEFFSETGHFMCPPFLGYWESRGLDNGDAGISYRESLALLGYPISERFVDQHTGRVVQYFERARLEYSPEDQENILQVPLGRLFDESDS